MTEIASALLSADVNIKFVARLRDAVKTQVTLQSSNQGANMRKMI